MLLGFTSFENGSRKESGPGSLDWGRLIMMEMPMFMKGFVNATTRCLSALMVRGAIARCAVYRQSTQNKLVNHYQYYTYLGDKTPN